MFDEKIILTRLQNGEDAQAIANEMAEMINAANKMYSDQKAKEAEEKAKAEAAEKAAAAKAIQKKEDLQEILDLFADWFHNYYDIEVKDELDAEQVLELIDSVKGYMEAIKDFESAFGLKLDNHRKPAKKIVKAKSADETINQFLKQMGW